MIFSRASICALILLVAAIMAGGEALAGDRLWVSDQMQLTVRVSPSMDGAAASTTKTGDSVEVLEETEKGWCKVRLTNGKEGWLLRRYLLKERPASMRLAELSPQAKEMSDKLEALNQENADLKTKVASLEAIKSALESASQKLANGGDKLNELVGENAGLKQELTQAKLMVQQAENRYAALARESRDVVGLQRERDELRAASEEQSAKLKELTNEVESLRSAGSLKWFLAGAGVLVLGWLMGVVLHRRRRRQGSLMD